MNASQVNPPPKGICPRVATVSSRGRTSGSYFLGSLESGPVLGRSEESLSQVNRPLLGRNASLNDRCY